MKHIPRALFDPTLKDTLKRLDYQPLFRKTALASRLDRTREKESVLKNGKRVFLLLSFLRVPLLTTREDTLTARNRGVSSSTLKSSKEDQNP